MSQNQEIERRVLIRKLGKTFPKDLPPINKEHFEQGYFILEPLHKSFRIRIIDHGAAMLTIKSGEGISRNGDEYPLGDTIARRLLELTTYRLQKTRYYIDGWKIDFFEEPFKGLIIAERKLSSTDELVMLPEWMCHAIEITDILTNQQLARLAADPSIKSVDVYLLIEQATQSVTV